MLLRIGLSVLKSAILVGGFVGGLFSQDTADVIATQDNLDFFITQDQ